MLNVESRGVKIHRQTTRQVCEVIDPKSAVWSAGRRAGRDVEERDRERKRWRNGKGEERRGEERGEPNSGVFPPTLKVHLPHYLFTHLFLFLQCHCDTCEPYHVGLRVRGGVGAGGRAGLDL